MSAVKPLLAIIVAVMAVIGPAVTSASAEPARASAASPQTIPANFSKLPASWHGYAPPASQRAAVSLTANVCSNSEAIFNGNSGLVLEVYESSIANGGVVDQWAYNGTQTQHWCFSKVNTWNGNPVYEIINNNSGMCLDLPNDNLVNGQHLQQWTCVGDEQQEWMWMNHDKYDTIVPFTEANSNIGWDYSMEVYNSSTGDGGEVDVWQNNFSLTQAWCPGQACTAGTTRLCVDSTSAGNQCIMDPGTASSTTGYDAQMTPVYWGAYSQWSYPNTLGTTGAIESFGGDCLQLNAAGGDTVRIAACVGDAAEMWINEYDGTNARTEFVSEYDPNLCLSADYADGIVKADSCANGVSWYQQWGTS
jgi:Ricin-type beta-trefoil lectin domain-like